MTRKLATVRRVADIRPIEGADMIHVVTVDGWKVVAQKAMGYKIGDLVVYFEIDSFIPHELAPFLTKEAAYPKEFNGVKGERLRTIKLRGQVSQGLLMPLEVAAAAEAAKFPDQKIDISFEEGDDLTEILGIQKWEAPISPQMQGQARGTFPTQYAPKTDQERIQNMAREVLARKNELFEWTLKLDGSSCTVFVIDGEIRVASRNLELKINEENMGNAYVKTAVQVGELVKANGFDNVAVQGELMGPGIQGNREGFKDVQFFVFDVVEVLNERKKMLPDERHKFVVRCGLQHAPIIRPNSELPFETTQDFLDFADSIKSINHTIAEGLVFKSCSDPEFSFKAISNKFLLKEKD